MLTLVLAAVFLVMGLVFFVLGARGSAGVTIQLGRTLLFLFEGLTVASLVKYVWP
jgi:hypothetical protein